MFLYGFAKSDRDNIGADDLIDLAQTGAAVMALSQREVGQMVEDKTLFEVSDDKNDN